MNDPLKKSVTETTRKDRDGFAAAEPSLDAVLDVLADARRRRLLIALLERDSLTVDDDGVPVDVPGIEEREGLAVELAHAHLPKLDRAGLVERNPETRELHRGPEFEAIRPLLRFVRDNADELPDGGTSFDTTA